MVPDKAVITAKTEEEAQRLLDFLRANGCSWGNGSTDTWWFDDREDTCYDIEPNRSIMHCSREWYEDQISAYEDGDDVDDICWLPADSSWLFISTDEFISRCTGYEEETGDIDISGLM